MTEETPAADAPETTVKRSKLHQDYWAQRIRQRSYRDGSGTDVILTEWQVYIQYLGVREWFQLGSSVKAAAARKAASIYASLRTVGWDKTREIHKPRSQVIQSPNVGEFLRAVEATGLIKAKTFALYARKLRKIVSDVAGIEGKKDKFRHRGAGAHKWRDKVDEVRLGQITPEVVEDWRRAHIAAVGNDAEKRDSAENTANSAIRNSRALFSSAVLAKIEGVQLPKPLPFEGVALANDKNARYVSHINPQKLIQAAASELRVQHPEQFKVFILALFCGLRRNEADKLLWRAVDFEKLVIRVELNPYFEPKAASSLGEVYLEPEVGALLEELKKESKGEFVVESANEPKLGLSYDHYRASAELNATIAWLRKQGVDTDNPLHTLRKEFGRLMTESHGIYAASKMLRHSSIMVTASYYAADQRRLTIGLGAALKIPAK